ncbi:hypothetical protein ACOME3_006680, partial [Neoechinorhynchus agilis]
DLHEQKQLLCYASAHGPQSHVVPVFNPMVHYKIFGISISIERIMVLIHLSQPSDFVLEIVVDPGKFKGRVHFVSRMRDEDGSLDRKRSDAPTK